MKNRSPERPSPARRPASAPDPDRFPLNWFRAWDRFWFRPSDPTTIGLIRLCTGLVVVYVRQRVQGWLPAFDIALLHAGEHSGRLDACFRLLGD